MIIDADEITGQSSDELVAKQARLSYGDKKLSAEVIYFNQVSGAARAENSVLFTDGEKYRMSSNLLNYFPRLGEAVASGEVRVTSTDGYTLWADLLRYELERKAVTGEDGIRFVDGNKLEMVAESFSYLLDERTGDATSVVIRHQQNAAAVSAAQVFVTPEGYSMDEAIYTTCKADDPGWLIDADHVELSVDGELVATGASLELFGLPVFYLPKLVYSLSDERQSGFLAPKFELLGSGRYSFELPYYLNLAPNYDAIASARWYSGRGVLGKIDGRWLFADSSGSGTWATIGDNDAGGTRGFGSLTHQGRINQFTNYELGLAEVSDELVPDDFFEGDNTAQRHFAKLARFEHTRQNWTLEGKVEAFQTIQQDKPNITKPYDILPGLYFAARPTLFQQDLSMRLQAENFHRYSDDDDNGFRVAGDIQSDYNMFIGGLRGDLSVGAAGSTYEVKQADWFVPYSTLQLRQAYNGEVNFGGKNFKSLFEPRIFAAAVAKRDFTDTPNYDTLRVEQSIQELFSVNPFAGSDRFEDSNFVAVGIGSQLWEEDAAQPWLDLQIGQQYRFSDSKVQATVESPPTAGWSNTILESRLHPNPSNTMLLRLVWNPDLDSFEQASIETQYRSRDGQVYSLGYTRNVESVVRRDRGLISFGIFRPLWENASFVGDFHYNLQTSVLDEINAGLRVMAECRCWEIDLLFEHQVSGATDRNSLRFQINLLGLGGFGSNNFEKLVDEIGEEL